MKKDRDWLLSVKTLLMLMFLIFGGVPQSVLAQERFELLKRKVLTQNDVPLNGISSDFNVVKEWQDVEVLDLTTGGNDFDKLEEQLARAQRVSVKESLEVGESVVDEPYDPCPGFVGAGELGFFDKKSMGRERCEIKKLLKQEPLTGQIRNIMWNLTCGDPVGIVEKKRMLLESGQMPDLNSQVLWERSLKRNDKICKEGDWSVLDPVFNVKSIGQAKFDNSMCKAALIEVRVINGIGALGSWGFILGLDACSGLNIGLSMSPEKVVFEQESENVYNNLLKTISGWNWKESIVVNKVGSLFSSTGATVGTIFTPADSLPPIRSNRSDSSVGKTLPQTRARVGTQH